MKYVIAFFVVLTMVSCVSKPHEGTATNTAGSPEKVATTVVFSEFPMAIDLPTEQFGDMRTAVGVNNISHASDKLAKRIFTKSFGLLDDPLFNNWKTVGPMHTSSNTATLVEARFDGVEPLWFRYEYATEMMHSGGYRNWLGFHDLVNLVAKYGNGLPSDTPIVAIGSVTAYRSFAFMSNANIIQSPVAIKRDGKWNMQTLSAVSEHSFSPKDRPPLFLYDKEDVDTYNPAPKTKISMFLREYDVRLQDK